MTTTMNCRFSHVPTISNHWLERGWLEGFQPSNQPQNNLVGSPPSNYQPSNQPLKKHDGWLEQKKERTKERKGVPGPLMVGPAHQPSIRRYAPGWCGFAGDGNEEGPSMNAEVMEPKTALQLALERLPKSCPACASPKVAPLFEGNWFDCADCAHTWEYR